MLNSDFDVAIIGMGPAGACLSSLLRQAGLNIVVFEREEFPRFSIGESLLPQCMEDLANAGFIEDIEKANFQFKDGALFYKGLEQAEFLFSEKFSPGRGDALEVKRDKFDKVLADKCIKDGVVVKYKHQLEKIELKKGASVLEVKNLEDDSLSKYVVDFVADASGFGRVLPRLLDLNKDLEEPSRGSLFCHVKAPLKNDPNKIGILVNEKNPEVWFWMIPFSDGTLSLGVVASSAYLADSELKDEDLFDSLVNDCIELKQCLEFPLTKVNKLKKIDAYGRGIKKLHGDSYVLLGNAGEFIDPIFSSGVTIACRSACLAAPLMIRELKGESVDWDVEFTQELSKGIDVFKEFVQRWYDGDLINVFFHTEEKSKIKEMICSILAGYAWDEENPFVKEPARRLNTVTEWVSL